MARLIEPPAGDDLERDRLARASVLVLGDATLERRVEGRFTQGGSGVLLLGSEHAAPGGGAAVVRALATLGVASAFICVIGDDLAGAQLTSLIGEQRNVEPWLLVDGARATVTETVYFDGGSVPVLQTLRQDTQPTGPDLQGRMVRIAVETLALTGVAIMTDRGHGTLDPPITQAVIGAARQAGRRTVADIGTLAPDCARYGQVDVLIRGDVAPGAADDDVRALRDACGAGAAALFRPDGAIVLADADGEVRFPCDDRDHAERVAVFAAALATGRPVRAAAAAAGRYALAAR